MLCRKEKKKCAGKYIFVPKYQTKIKIFIFSHKSFGGNIFSGYIDNKIFSLVKRCNGVILQVY